MDQLSNDEIADQRRQVQADNLTEARAAAENRIWRAAAPRELADAGITEAGATGRERRVRGELHAEAAVEGQVRERQQAARRIQAQVRGRQVREAVERRQAAERRQREAAERRRLTPIIHNTYSITGGRKSKTTRKHKKRTKRVKRTRRVKRKRTRRRRHRKRSTRRVNRRKRR